MVTKSKTKFIEDLKGKAEKKLNKQIEVIYYKDFFNFLFKENEQRKLDMATYYKKKKMKDHKH